MPAPSAGLSSWCGSGKGNNPVDASSAYTLITGASSGIGRAIAVRLSATMPLILHGRDEARLAETRGLCAAPDRHLCWRHDLREIDLAAGSLRALLAEHGATVAHFVHSAGMATVLPPRMITAAATAEIFNVNFISAAAICGLLTQKTVNQRQLRGVVFISSIWSKFSTRGHSLYGASKAALDGLMRGLALDLAPEVRVNSVLPGAVPSAMAAQGFADAEIAGNLHRDYPLGTGQAEDVAGLVAFLLSDEARWITGQQFVIDGGRTVNMSLK